MSTTPPRPLFVCALLLVGPLAGCDAEAPGAQAVDYRSVGHVELSAVRATPWVKQATKDGALQLDAALGACADLAEATDAVTFGATSAKDAFEVYIQGSFDSAAANACADHIDAEIASRPARPDRPKPEATLLREGLFVVFGGNVTPSRDRLEALLDSDPSSGQPMWVTMDMTGKANPVDHVVAWANPKTGMNGHAEVTFTDEATAMETYGKATLGLTAMSLSDEVGEFASAVDLKNSGRTMTAEVKLSADQMKSLVAKGKERHKARAHMRARSHGSDGGGHGVHIEFKAGE